MITSLVSLAAVLSTFSNHALAASCKDFTIHQHEGTGEDSFTQPSIRTFIVSKGFTCQSTTGDCNIPIEAFVTDHRSLNISIEDSSSIYDLIESKSQVEFLETLTGNLSSVSSFPIRANTSGHVGYTPNHRCVEGTLLDCDDDKLENVAVEACTPYSNTDDGISGTMATVTTSKEAADALTCNPANSTEARNGEDPPTGCGGEDGQDEEQNTDGQGQSQTNGTEAQNDQSGAGHAVISISLLSMALASVMIFVI